MSGPDCSTPRRRTRFLSRRSSRGFANVGGSVRDRQVSPSILSKSNCCEDRPMKPASNARRACVPSRPVHRRWAASRCGWRGRVPMVAVRMSECPRKAAIFGPSGRASSALTYPSALFHVRALSTAAMTCSRGSLHAAEQVSGVPPADVDRGQRAGADQNGGDTVPNRLGQSGTVEHFDVVVRVDVHEPGSTHLPAASMTCGQPVSSSSWGHRGNAAADDADGANGRRGTGSVEPASVSNDGVVTRSVTHRHSKPRW